MQYLRGPANRTPVVQFYNRDRYDRFSRNDRVRPAGVGDRYTTVVEQCGIPWNNRNPCIHDVDHHCKSALAGLIDDSRHR